MQGWQKTGLWLILLIMAAYPVFRNEIYGYTDVQEQRHKDVLEGKSVFFNPWQYRVLSPYVLEGMHRILSPTLYKWVGVENAYLFSFRLFRFLINLLLLAAAWRYFKLFSPNLYLQFFALLFTAILIGNGTAASDYSFSTWVDTLFFIYGGLLLMGALPFQWILPLSIVSAFNKETSLLIPVLFIIFQIDFKNKSFKDRTQFTWGLASLALNIAIYSGLRLYFGTGNHLHDTQFTSHWQLLQHNIGDLRTWIETIGTTALLPLFVLLFNKKLSPQLRLLFWLVVPLWFGVHFYMAWAREARYYLVPVMLVCIPAVLYLAEKTKNISAD